MVRRWSHLITLTTPLDRGLLNKFSVRRTRKAVKVKWHSFFPTAFLVSKQSWWLLRYDYRYILNYYIEWLNYSMNHFKFLRFVNTPISWNYSQPIVLLWPHERQMFWGETSTTIATTFFNPMCRALAHPSLLPLTWPTRLLTQHPLDIMSDEEHASTSLTPLVAREFPPVSKLVIDEKLDLESCFLDLFDYSWYGTRQYIQLQYSMMQLLAIWLSLRF